MTEQTWVVSVGRRLAVAGSLVLLACATAARADEAEIKQIYVAKCQICHMADGNSAIPDMNFTDGKWLHGSRVAEIAKVIEEGVPGKAMLPFKTQLTSEQIAGLAQFVRTFDKTLKPEGKPAKKK